MARFMTTEHLRAGRSQISAPIYGAADSQQKRRPSKGGGDSEASGKGGGSKKIAKKGKELKEDMDALGPVRLKDAEAARQQMVKLVREMDAQGEIDIRGSGGDQYVV